VKSAGFFKVLLNNREKSHNPLGGYLMSLTLDEIKHYVQRIDMQIISLFEKRDELMEMAKQNVVSDIDTDEWEQSIVNNIEVCIKEFRVSPQLIQEIYKVIFNQYIDHLKVDEILLKKTQIKEDKKVINK
jgi:chorismate mutase